MSGHTGVAVRAEAAKIVNEVVSGGRSLDAALENVQQYENPADRALLQYLCYGVLRRHWQLRAWMGELLDRPLRPRDAVVESLIAVGLYQLTDSRVPDHAAVSMTVEATRLLNRPKLAPLVNAVLRNFRRMNIHDITPANDEIRYSHPAWLIDLLRHDWPEHWQQILEANNERAAMWLRVNQRHHTAESYLQKLPAVGDDSGLLEGVGSAIRLAAPLSVDDLPGFDDGHVSVQDGAAQLAALWLGGGKNLRTLDACAAPGGKTGHLLEIAGESSSLTALDSDPLRLAKVEENLARLGLNATLVCGDASNPDQWWDGEPFDRILLDVPCSATGVIRRHPDIKLLRRASDIGELAALQQRMLRALWTLLKPGGRLLYVTCSVLSQENDAQIAAFLATAEDATENRMLPNYNIHDLMQSRVCGYQILPGTMGLDGFFFACLEKEAG